jgi:eukaryotic-like serine/threonine-protein kinase
MPADLHKARALFLHAVGKLPPEQWDGYVAETCGGDAELERQVGRLLQVHREAGSFLDRPAVAVGATGTFTSVPGEGAAAVPPRERPGTVIGPYKLLQQIGEGGMGTVFMAEQTRPVQRKVALKVIKPGMDSRQVIARFEAERQALALMDHVNIARVLDAGATESGLPYFVMELVHGVPITRYCDDNRLTPRERLELFIPVCQAIQHAHQKGVIHRDIKPSNVMVTLYDGQPVPKVIDFGVAKATEQKLTEATLFTQYGTLVGTLEYMSPEQAEMSALGVDTRSDIYSLGVLLYELLTGSTPLTHKRMKEAAHAEILRMIKEEEPPRPSTRLSDSGETLASISVNRHMEPAKLTRLVRGELDWIVMKCLEKDRNRRYETAKDFAADVQRYLIDEPVHACPPSVGYRLRTLVRRHRGPVLAVSLVVLALVVGIIGTTWGMLRATDAEAVAVNEAKQKDDALTDKVAALAAAEQSERDAKKGLWLSLYEQARARRFSRQMGQRLDSLDALAQAARLRKDDRLRDEAIAAMALPDVRLGSTWQGWPPGYCGWAFDAEYRLYARTSDKGVISIRSLPDDREIRTIVSGPGQVLGLFLSPDGRYLAKIEDSHALKVWRVADGEAVLRWEPRQIRGWAFSPDSRQLAVDQQGWILRFDLATGQELNRWQLHEKTQSHVLAFHPDNSKLAVGYARSNVASVYDAASGALLTDLPVGAMTETVVAWNPDGRRLAVTGSLENPVIQIWDVAARRKVAMLEGHPQRVTYLSFHPDGDLLASASWDGVVRLWHPSTGRQLMQLPITAVPQFSSDGRWLGVAQHGEQAQLLEMATTREYRTLVSSLGAGQDGYNLDSDISPDGQLLAQAMNDAVRLWHLASGRELAVLPPGRPLFQSNRELLIAGPGGLQRWPIQPGAAANELRLGPPRTIALPAPPVRAARSEDGRTLAVVSETGGKGLLVDLASDSVRAPNLEHARAGYVALSRDGRWMASSGWHSDRVRLWNAETGKMVHEWMTGTAMVFITPDSRELIISRRDEFGFHDVETLKPSRRIRRDVALHPGHVAFSPDGGLMALEMAPGVIHLKEVTTARTVAKLEDPHGDRAGWMSFTPDGTQLVVTAPYARAVHVWDLRAIRERLKGMELDWDRPEFPPADPKAKTAALVKVEVLLGDLAKPELTREQEVRQAIEQYRRRADAKPDDAEADNCLAWLYLTAPEALRDTKAALPLAEKAVRLNPGNANYRNTLGVAYYRAGRYREAVDTLRPNLDKQEEWGLAFDLYFLAMSYHRLGETARARDFYDWAVRWPRSDPRLKPGHLKELDMFRAEAAELLGIEAKKD